jgi:hypothetical protein
MFYLITLQSILIPPVADWLYHELQAPFGEYADIVTLGIAYFSLLDNNWSKEQCVVDPAMVHSDLLHYAIFYYLICVDVNMNRLAMFQVREHHDECVWFFYACMLNYYNQLVHATTGPSS